MQGQKGINNTQNIADGWWRDKQTAVDLNFCDLDWKLLIRNCSELSLSVITAQTFTHSMLIKLFSKGPWVQFTLCSNHEFAVNKLSKLEKSDFSVTHCSPVGRGGRWTKMWLCGTLCSQWSCCVRLIMRFYCWLFLSSSHLFWFHIVEMKKFDFHRNSQTIM